MRWAVVAFLAAVGILVFLVIVAHWPIRVSVSVRRGPNQTLLVVKVAWWPYAVQVPIIRRHLAGGGMQLGDVQDFSDALDQVLDTGHRVLNELSRWVPAVISLLSLRHRLIRLTWRTSIGATDAAATAVASGALAAAKSALLALALARWDRDRDVPAVSVTPLFSETGFRTELDCVIQIVPVTIIRSRNFRRAYRLLRRGRNGRNRQGHNTGDQGNQGMSRGGW
ncbi:MAG: DUF2953 domain-containing protein [Firmicutes bacterium]|nr:DUF2953 domain-containing protein [Bacillota bacterium]